MKLSHALTLPWVGSVRLPTTARDLWIWLATAVAVNHLLLSYRMQSIDFVVLAALAWGGAYLCIEDRLATLKPDPSALSMTLGSLLLLGGL